MADKVNRRKELGSLIRGEVIRRGWNFDDTPDKFHMARATVYRAMDGDPKISELTFAKIEAGLQLPRSLFAHFISGDRVWIDALPIGVTDGYDADARRVFLEPLTEIKLVRRRARQTGT